MLLNRTIGLAGLCALATAGGGCSQPRPEASALVDTLSRYDSVKVKLEAPARITAGTPVMFRLTLTNPTDRQMTLYLLGREVTFDVTVFAPDGSIAWRRLDDSPFQDILAVRTLAPRQEIVLQTEWSSPVRSGSYTATGIVFTDQEPLRTTPVKFAITAAPNRRPLADRSTPSTQDDAR